MGYLARTTDGGLFLGPSDYRGPARSGKRRHSNSWCHDAVMSAISRETRIPTYDIYLSITGEGIRGLGLPDWRSDSCFRLDHFEEYCMCRERFSF